MCSTVWYKIYANPDYQPCYINFPKPSNSTNAQRLIDKLLSLCPGSLSYSRVSKSLSSVILAFGKYILGNERDFRVMRLTFPEVGRSEQQRCTFGVMPKKIFENVLPCFSSKQAIEFKYYSPWDPAVLSPLMRAAEVWCLWEKVSIYKSSYIKTGEFNKYVTFSNIQTYSCWVDMTGGCLFS